MFSITRKFKTFSSIPSITRNHPVISFRLNTVSFFRDFSIVSETLSELGIDTKGSTVAGVFDGEAWNASGDIIESINPATNEVLSKVQLGSEADYERCVKNIVSARKSWANTPPPKRGDIIRQVGDELRLKRTALGRLISMEMGKITAEGVGEVQEYIDICDYAVGLSRMMEGKVLPSERQDHNLYEVYNPLGSVGIITAFNFPCAVAGWNSAISLVAGNTQIVKGAESTSLVNIATQKIVTEVLKRNGVDTKVSTLCQGSGKLIGERMCTDDRIDLVSFTGSTKVGRDVQRIVGDRFGKSLLELGGNNAVIIQPSFVSTPNGLSTALTSVLFGAVGTCGQRCTSLRRLLVHSEVYDKVVDELKKLYNNVNDLSKGELCKIGDPVKKSTLVGPLHKIDQVRLYEKKVYEMKEQGGRILSGGRKVVFPENHPDAARLKQGHYVHPTLVEIKHSSDIVKEENFVPILYVCKYNNLDEAIAMNNSVDQGLSSALFTHDMRDVFKWLGPNGSDTGIVNVNTGCSGAEIGGAFGGNKHTGWGRESGSDSWKQYMRRATCTVNYGNALPLAQGITFS